MTPRAVICRLCFETKALSELSRSASGVITDICLVCRESELRAVLAQVESILSMDAQLARPKHPDNEITVEVVVKKYECGHVDDGGWSLICPTCAGFPERI
jgi:hypothetical protein